MPSPRDAHLEILRVLKQEPEDTVTIVAVGPLTNIAMAAMEDPVTFSKGIPTLLSKVGKWLKENST